MVCLAIVVKQGIGGKVSRGSCSAQGGVVSGGCSLRDDFALPLMRIKHGGLLLYDSLYQSYQNRRFT